MTKQVATIDSLMFNVGRMKAGVWVPVTAPGGTTFSLKVRGYTQIYHDYLAKLRRDAAIRLNQKITSPPYIDADSLPPSENNKCLGEALATEVFLDVKELFAADGETPITADEFAERLRDPETWSPLIVLVMAAASNVTSMRDEQIKNLGNSSAPPSE
jgi:hypothetical protein